MEKKMLKSHAYKKNDIYIYIYIKKYSQLWQSPIWSSVLFLGEKIFSKFQPEKYDFNLYKGFSMEKWPKFLPDFKEKNNIQIAKFLQ
jgi:hypothetical protein